MIIGISGKARSGKDTIANYLVEKYGFSRVGWAERLKKGIAVFHGWDERHIEGELKDVVDPKWGYSPRHAFVGMGTDLIRNQWDVDFWVKSALLPLMDKPGYFCFADTRFPNEGEKIRELGGINIRVVRADAQKVESDDHESEAGLPDHLIDHVIENNSTLEHLYAKVREILQD